MRESVEAYLALGSNLGDREGNLRRALALLAERLEITRCSSIYESEPWGYTGQEKFLNMVCSVHTSLSPQELLAWAKEVERRLGRTSTIRHGPRTIDVDILLYGREQVDEPELAIPHAGLAERPFVLVPLAEVAPQVVHPVTGQRVTHLRDCVAGREGVRWWSDPPTEGQLGT